MRIPNETDLWTQRWAALSEAIEHSQTRKPSRGMSKKIKAIAESFGKEAAIVNHRLRQTVDDYQHMLEGLQYFADPLFECFHKQLAKPGRTDDHEDGERSEQISTHRDHQSESSSHSHPAYPPNYLLQTLLQQVSIDLNNLQRAYDQRFANAADSTAMVPQQITLLVADAVARLSVQPAIDANLLGNGGGYGLAELDGATSVSILSYLNAQVEVRIVPYCDAVLMGVPFSAFAEWKEINDETSTSFSPDLLAIPHEVAHLIFRHGRVQQPHRTTEQPDSSEPLQALLAGHLFAALHRSHADLESSIWLFEWLEEIFADAYGCLLAGPANLVDFQRMLATGLPTDHHHGPHKHPTPVVRPLIQQRILAALYPDRAETGERLATEWRTWVADHWQVHDIEGVIYEVAGRSLSGRQILNQVAPLIDVVVAGLREWIGDAEKIVPWFDSVDIRGDAVSVMLDGAFVRDAVEGGRKEGQPIDGMGRLESLQELIDGGDVNTIAEQVLFRGWSYEGPQMPNIR